MNRRGFLKLLGLAPIAAVGGVVAARTAEEPGAKLLSYDFDGTRLDFDPPIQLAAGQKVTRVVSRDELREFAYGSSYQDGRVFYYANTPGFREQVANALKPQ